MVVAPGAATSDHAGVPPLKEIYPGALSVAMDVTVEVTRLAWAGSLPGLCLIHADTRPPSPGAAACLA